MYKKKKIIALIPARAGSKGVPGKNHRMLAGRMLAEWTFFAAKNCAELDDVLCSSDDKLVLGAARKAQLHLIKRPARLAQDTTPMLPVFSTTNLIQKISEVASRN